MTAPVTFGFDAMCADISFLNIGPHLETIRARFPDLDPLMATLLRGADDEIAAESIGLDADGVAELMEELRALDGVTLDIHIGANTSQEVVTAQNLMAEPADPIGPMDIMLLGNASQKVLDRVPETIHPEILRHAEPVDSEAISLIFPHEGKRVIVSYGGDPPLRRLSPSLRAYLRERLPAILAEVRPKVSLLVGTTNTWATASPEDLSLLEEVIASVKGAGARALLDLGGIGSWTLEKRRRYFDAVGHADVIFSNEHELARLYEDTTGSAPPGEGARDVAAMAREVARDGQAVVVHTSTFQIAYNVPETAARAMDFASRAAAIRASRGVFPTARQISDASLAPSAEGTSCAAAVAREDRIVAGSAYAVGAKNTVGLGDTWTASFILAALGLGIF